MKGSQFDRFADEYASLHAGNISITGEPPEYFAEYKIRYTRKLWAAQGRYAENLRILDFGTGVGNSVEFFAKYFPRCQLVCVDVSRRSLDIARSRFGNSADFVLFNGDKLPFRQNSFDLAFTACVFHHIAVDEHIALLREIRRVLATDGRLCLFEHNPFNPLTVRAVRTCAFDEDAILIRPSLMRERFRRAGYSEASVHYCVFFPRFLKHLRSLEPWLAAVPFGAQYCVVGAGQEPAVTTGK